MFCYRKSNPKAGLPKQTFLHPHEKMQAYQEPGFILVAFLKESWAIAGRERAEERKYFCSQRVVKLWNSLPLEAVLAPGLDGFQKGLGRFLERRAHRS